MSVYKIFHVTMAGKKDVQRFAKKNVWLFSSSLLCSVEANSNCDGLNVSTMFGMMQIDDVEAVSSFGAFTWRRNRDGD